MQTDVVNWIKSQGIKFLENLGISQGQTVVDFGCNVGHYTIPAAKLVGENGKVYAIDKDAQVLDKLKKTANSENLQNIVVLHNFSAEPKIDLPDEIADAALLYDILHYLSTAERNAVYREIRRVLKNNALLSVYPKHCKSDMPMWHLAEMSLDDIAREIEITGFRSEGRFYKELLHDDYLDKGNILLFRKK